MLMLSGVIRLERDTNDLHMFQLSLGARTLWCTWHRACRTMCQASGFYQGWRTVSYNSVQCSFSGETADQRHCINLWKNQGCVRPVQQAKGQCGLQRFQAERMPSCWHTFARSQQSTTGIPTRHRPCGRSDMPEVWRRPAYLRTLALWVSCTDSYAATSLWVYTCISEPALSRTSQVRHAGKEVSEAPLACMPAHNNNNLYNQLCHLMLQ